MNSSGIKRGLATTAVSALAITGIPFIASSASAENGDVITVAAVGPARDGGDLGAEIVLETKNITEAEVNPLLLVAPNEGLKVIAQDLTNPATNALQTIGDVEFVDFIEDASADSKFGRNDGFDEIVVRIPVDTRTTGATAEFAVFLDDDGDEAVDSTEAASDVEVQTSGAPSTIAITPSIQSAPLNTDSGEYTATLKDSAGRTTQLTGTEEVRLAATSAPANGDVLFNPEGAAVAPLDLDEVGTDGVFKFAAQGDEEGLYRLRAASYADAGGATPIQASGTVSLDVNGNVAGANTISPQEVNLVTGADNRDGFGLASDEAQVRPDQTSVTFEIRDNSGTTPAELANAVVTLTATSTEVTFGGQTSQAQTVTLNSLGRGSVTFTVDAASIQDGDSFLVDSPSLAGDFDVNYEAPDVTDATVDTDQETYISAFGGTVNPVVTVTDQYGTPVSNVYVSYELDNGANDTNGVMSERVATDANGEVTLSITDTEASALNNGTDDLLIDVYDGRFAGSLLAENDDADIVYTADGQGADFLVTVDGQTPGSAAYDPTIVPLTDAIGDDPSEIGSLLIIGGTPGAAATVTVDNGALILDPDSDDLADATVSLTGSEGDTFEIVGTTEGVVNITIASGGRTKTATLTVEAPEDNSADARNIALEGPAGAVAGDVVDFTATITDAFGNPVTGFDADDIEDRITGPGNDQGNSGDSDENGEIVYQVEITQSANNPVTLRLDADDVSQFGADADQFDASSTSDDAPGLSASVDTASATVNVVDIEELEAAVEAAERDLAESQANLAVAQARLDVAQTELAIAQSEVDRLQERKQNLRQKLNKAKRNDNRQKAKTTRKKLRNVKRQLNDAKNAVIVAQTAVDGEQVVVNLRQTEVDRAEEALAQAQADLDEAQN